MPLAEPVPGVHRHHAERPFSDRADDETLEGRRDVAKRHQRGNRENRKPKAERPKTPAETSSLARTLGTGSVKSGAPKKAPVNRLPRATTRGPMSQHKFKVGQLVDYNPGRLGMLTSAKEYKALRLLPVEGGDLLYRIKSIGEMFERVAKERELARREG